MSCGKDIFHIFRVTFHPSACHKKGHMNVMFLQNLQDFLCVFIPPCGVKGKGNLLLLSIHTVNGQFTSVYIMVCRRQVCRSFITVFTFPILSTAVCFFRCHLFHSKREFHVKFLIRNRNFLKACCKARQCIGRKIEMNPLLRQIEIGIKAYALIYRLQGILPECFRVFPDILRKVFCHKLS